ncbi:MAG: hypothetical protein Q9157_005181 [Trypethelium eluteriae]
MSPYPSKDEIAELATHLSTSDPSPFYDRVSPNVVWDVLESWKKSALGVANKFLKEPLRFKVVNAFGGGEQDWCCLELEAIDAVAKNDRRVWTRNQRNAVMIRPRHRGNPGSLIGQARTNSSGGLLIDEVLDKMRAAALRESIGIFGWLLSEADWRLPAVWRPDSGRGETTLVVCTGLLSATPLIGWPESTLNRTLDLDNPALKSLIKVCQLKVQPRVAAGYQFLT